MKSEQLSMEEMYPLILEVLESGGEFRLYPRGTSMLPMLREGRDSVILTVPTHCTPRDICLYRRKNGQFVLHRLMRFEEGGTPVFCGDNQLYFEYGVPEENIIAKVTAYYRGEKRIALTSRRYRFYVLLHCCMPLRRIRFLPRRIKGCLKRLFSKKQ